jgi:ATP-dependent protease ClpP protease subunit
MERRETINKLLCKYTSQSMEQMQKATAFDHWFDASEAVAFGLADGIATEEKLFTLISGGK